MKFNKSTRKEHKSSVADIFGFDIELTFSPNVFITDFQYRSTCERNGKKTVVKNTIAEYAPRQQ